MPVKLSAFPPVAGDYYPSFVAAIAEAAAQGAGIIEVQGGDIIASQQVTLPPGMSLKGEGPLHTRLIGAGLTGAVVRSTGFYCGVSDMAIDSTAERKAANDVSGYGIWQEAEDAPGKEARLCTYSRLIVQNQPRHAMLFVAGIMDTVVAQALIKGNGGHGIAINHGATTGRVNVTRPGGIRIIDSTIQDNVGHSVKAGQSGAGITGVAYRVFIDNCDTFRNATEDGIRSHNSGMHIFAENSEINNSALCGFAGVGGADPATGGIWVMGRGLKLKNNRYVGVVGQAAYVGNSADLSTQDVELDGILVSSSPALLNPAVRVDSSARGVRAITHTKAGITRLLDVNAVQFYSDFGGVISTDFA